MEGSEDMLAGAYRTIYIKRAAIKQNRVPPRHSRRISSLSVTKKKKRKTCSGVGVGALR